MESTITTEIATMNCIYDGLLKMKQALCEQIDKNKLKCKTFTAPIVQ